MASEDDEVDLASEIETLKSIYIKELELEQDESGCKSITLHLFPATADVESQKYVRLSLTLILPEEYPKVVPDIVVKNTRGLSDDDIERIYADGRSKAEAKKGTPMLFEIIEVVQEYLTKGNTPSCDCAICLCSFSKDDIFVKTECYHYFHSHCLATYVKHCWKTEKISATETEDNENEVLCPICRLAISFGIHTPEVFPVPEESLTSVDFVLTDEIRQMQLQMESLLKKQQSCGGIIDPEAEKNKFLLEISNVPSALETSPLPSSTEIPDTGPSHSAHHKEMETAPLKNDQGQRRQVYPKKKENARSLDGSKNVVSEHDSKLVREKLNKSEENKIDRAEVRDDPEVQEHQKTNQNRKPRYNVERKRNAYNPNKGAFKDHEDQSQDCGLNEGLKKYSYNDECQPHQEKNFLEQGPLSNLKHLKQDENSTEDGHLRCSELDQKYCVENIEKEMFLNNVMAEEKRPEERDRKPFHRRQNEHWKRGRTDDGTFLRDKDFSGHKNNARGYRKNDRYDRYAKRDSVPFGGSRRQDREIQEAEGDNTKSTQFDQGKPNDDNGACSKENLNNNDVQQENNSKSVQVSDSDFPEFGVSKKQNSKYRRRDENYHDRYQNNRRRHYNERRNWGLENHQKDFGESSESKIVNQDHDGGPDDGDEENVRKQRRQIDRGGRRRFGDRKNQNRNKQEDSASKLQHDQLEHGSEVSVNADCERKLDKNEQSQDSSQNSEGLVKETNVGMPSSETDLRETRAPYRPKRGEQRQFGERKYWKRENPERNVPNLTEDGHENYEERTIDSSNSDRHLVNEDNGSKHDEKSKSANAEEINKTSKQTNKPKYSKMERKRFNEQRNWPRRDREHTVKSPEDRNLEDEENHKTNDGVQSYDKHEQELRKTFDTKTSGRRNSDDRRSNKETQNKKWKNKARNTSRSLDEGKSIDECASGNSNNVENGRTSQNGGVSKCDDQPVQTSRDEPENARENLRQTNDVKPKRYTNGYRKGNSSRKLPHDRQMCNCTNVDAPHREGNENSEDPRFFKDNQFQRNEQTNKDCDKQEPNENPIKGDNISKNGAYAKRPKKYAGRRKWEDDSQYPNSKPTRNYSNRKARENESLDRDGIQISSISQGLSNKPAFHNVDSKESHSKTDFPEGITDDRAVRKERKPDRELWKTQRRFTRHDDTDYSSMSGQCTKDINDGAEVSSEKSQMDTKDGQDGGNSGNLSVQKKEYLERDGTGYDRRRNYKDEESWKARNREYGNTRHQKGAQFRGEEGSNHIPNKDIPRHNSQMNSERYGNRGYRRNYRYSNRNEHTSNSNTKLHELAESRGKDARTVDSVIPSDIYDDDKSVVACERSVQHSKYKVDDEQETEFPTRRGQNLEKNSSWKERDLNTANSGENRKWYSGAFGSENNASVSRKPDFQDHHHHTESNAYAKSKDFARQVYRDSSRSQSSLETCVDPGNQTSRHDRSSFDLCSEVPANASQKMSTSAQRPEFKRANSDGDTTTSVNSGPFCSTDSQVTKLQLFHPPGFPAQPMNIRPPPGFAKI